MEIEHKKWYLSEFVHVDGYHEIVMNIVDICNMKNEITVAITDQGKIFVQHFELKRDGERLYFEYGRMLEKIDLDEFQQVNQNRSPF